MDGAVVAGAATLIAVDVADNKLEKAKLFWATHTINSTITDPVAEVQRITGRGAVGAFDLVGIPAVTQEVVDIARPGEGLCCTGILDPTATVPILIGAGKCFRDVDMGSTTPKHDIPLHANLYLQGRFRLDELISKEVAVDEIDAGCDALHDPAVTRVVITGGLG
ncbi:zinc-binding dehydrogenase [Microbacterium sp. Y-01]|uniref:zinc-binding dehydrogenase n=1 Tax=Microbacterium sp. Y-01 TaxID=2048898 RepID=UPI0013DD89B1|nr:zinc-binding dehydrogenase [Microbacterium sp. Y-01]